MAVHNIVELGNFAALIPSFTDQQQHPPVASWRAIQQLHRRLDRIEDYCSAVPPLNIFEIVLERVSAACEIARQMYFAVELLANAKSFALGSASNGSSIARIPA